MHETNRMRGALLLAAALIGTAPPLAAQTRLDLPGGFTPDPMILSVGVTSGLAASDWVRGCPGFVPETPPLVIGLTGPVVPLRFYATGAGLAGFVVVGADAVHRCAPADATGWAALRVDPMLEGEYAVFPALVESGVAATIEIRVSEGDQTPAVPEVAAQPLMATAAPAFGIHDLAADGAVEVGVTLAGPVFAGNAAPGCSGQIDPARPDAVLRLTGPLDALSIRALADVDTTLVVSAPDGTLFCNDDSDGYNPAVTAAPAAAGDWAVWVGYLSDGEGTAATLLASPGAPPPPGDAAAPPATLEASAAPAAGVLELGPEGGIETPLTLAATADATGFGPGCAGYIDPARPDALLRLAADEPSLSIGAVAAEDTTLLVRGPDGVVTCNDDGLDLNPLIALAPAVAGDYAVWVGTFSGPGGTATLVANRDPAAIAGQAAAMPATAAAMPNPFAGRTLESATQALEIMIAEQGLGEAFAYERLESTGPEDFTLHGVTITDPSGTTPPLKVGRLSVSDIDLVGLAATGQPDRFVINFEDVDYSALVTAGEMAMLPLPALAGNPPLSMSASLLPAAGDTTRRDVAIGLSLENQFALGVKFRVRWPGTPSSALDLQNLPTEAMSIELENFGFLDALITAQATQMGMPPDAAVTMALDALKSTLGPHSPGSPQDKLLTSLSKALAARAGHGVLRLSLATEDPRGIEALMEELKGDVLDERIEFDASFAPVP